jgi:peptidoglycan hydrolase-like protein with peptidoglycan-binding domain
MLLRKAYLDIPLRKVYLMPGCTGSSVSSLQTRLIELGFLTTVTGHYDADTQQAVSLFQINNSLPETGIADWKTYLYIFRDVGTEITPLPSAVAQATSNAFIQISRSARTLSLYLNSSLYRQYPIAVGKPNTPSPLGNYAIATKVPNPGGILGTRWMGLNYDSYGIHGTNRPWLIGQAVSLGCIRMHNAHVEEVFSKVKLGTSVQIRE